jgi:hypothetical protein
MKTTAGLTAALIFMAGTAVAQQPVDPTTWSTWGDTRILGVVDNVAQQQTFGVYGMLGADTKVQPWLTLGMGVGYENLNTQSWSGSGARTIENGVGLQPYATFQLNPNIFLTAFAAVTRVSYDAVLSPGVTGQFNAWRWLGGGNLTGVWHDGAWRFQPSLIVLYGQEDQDGYTTSAGTSVSPQQLPFGRISLGPEVGYAFARPGAWAFEPFVFARGNVDYVQPNVSVVTGTTIASAQHGAWSGSLGGGFSINTRQGFFARVQASNESVGQYGESVWLGEFRGGWKF